MIPYKIIGGKMSAELGEPSSSDNWMDVMLKFLVRVNGQEQEVPVRAKLVIGSHLMDREIEVYAPHWPDGANIQADELQHVVRGYVFAFLNIEGTIQEYKSEGFFTQERSHQHQSPIYGRKASCGMRCRSQNRCL